MVACGACEGVGKMEFRDPLTHPYRGREAVLSTKHGKERVLAPFLMAAMDLKLRVPEGVDTDTLGTFTGEVPRTGTPREVALRKARMGMAATGLPLGLANEGSFGPHPQLGIVPGNHEVLLFVDDELGIQVVEETLSTQTNFAHKVGGSVRDLAGFLEKVGFPAHGLIVRPNSGLQPGLLFKGVTTMQDLEEAVDRCARASTDKTAHVATDMRAHMNPTRQKVIGEVAERLAQRLLTRCLQCGTPGWGLVDVVRGLPCELCGWETDLVREEVHGCPRCDFRENRPRADGLDRAYAGNCPCCNP